ncbi:MAG: phosphotransferase, partial [Bacillota bacterium]|nr:phosphotransferase [Bacillota bacterium]
DNKEIWIYENILPSFPSIYPKIIDKSPDDSKNTRWIIYEDLGNIRHLFTEKVVLQVIEQMITWHSLRIDTVINEPLIGAKPKIEEVRNDLHSNMDEGMQTFSPLGMDKERILRILKLMEEADFTQFPVLVHGDLHLGNYGLSHGKLVIMDWEHVHVNTRYCDLYHLLDLSHPLFPKTMEREFRSHILNQYYERAVMNGLNLSLKDFTFEYYLYACVFSLWMILLIQKDLVCKEEKWPKKTLRNQMNESLQSFEQCSLELFEILKNR